MPGQKEEKMALTVWLDKGLAERVQRPAEKGGLTKSKFLSRLIEVGTEEVKQADKGGLWALTMVYHDFRLRLRKKVRRSVEAGRKRTELD